VPDSKSYHHTDQNEDNDDQADNQRRQTRVADQPVWWATTLVTVELVEAGIGIDTGGAAALIKVCAACIASPAREAVTDVFIQETYSGTFGGCAVNVICVT
jgi:hypothetical protein